jgi:hypothetical protein
MILFVSEFRFVLMKARCRYRRAQKNEPIGADKSESDT